MLIGTEFKKLVSQQEEESIGTDTRRDDFVVTGSKESFLEVENQLNSVYPIKASIIGGGSEKSMKALNRIIRWGEDGDIIPT